ncbi:MAG: hypothetical protein II307_05330 [Alistipes sp.]|nr:hypothetical protein [Alistipes sp.]MBQ2395166.1 hypothetical protein [Alistipes sp.]
MNKFLEWSKRSISPAFIAMFVAAFIMWYITKLNYTYTTDYNVRLNIDGEKIEVPCVIEGKGTNLFNYKFQLSKRLRIPLDELTYKAVPDDFGGTFLQIDPKSLQNAISVRVSDIKIVSLGEIPMLSQPETEEEESL